MDPDRLSKLGKDVTESLKDKLPEPTAAELTEQIAQLYHQQEMLIEKLAEIDPRPAKLTADSQGWYTMQMHHHHEIELLEDDDSHDIIIICHDCNRTIAKLEGK